MAGEVGVSRPVVWSMLNIKTAALLVRSAVTYRNLPTGSTVRKFGIDKIFPGTIVDTEAGVVGVRTPVVWLMVNMETVASSLLAV